MIDIKCRKFHLISQKIREKQLEALPQSQHKFKLIKQFFSLKRFKLKKFHSYFIFCHFCHERNKFPCKKKKYSIYMFFESSKKKKRVRQ